MFWQSIVEREESFGMGIETIQYQQHKFLPIYRWRPKTLNKSWNDGYNNYQLGYLI